MIGAEGDFTPGRMDLPLGFPASPAIFPTCAEVIQRVQRSMLLTDLGLGGGRFTASSLSAMLFSSKKKYGGIAQETVDGW